MANAYYPPVGFYFRVEFGPGGSALDNAFQEVSGLTVELETEELGEGGQNMFKYKVPVRARYENLVLKRGMVAYNSQLAKWFQDTLGADFATPIRPQPVLVSLLNAQGQPLVCWSFDQAWPVKWSLSDLNAEESALAIESMELAYTRFQRV